MWEIGSRDGRDGVALLHAFPGCVVHAFEPNPDTYPSVEHAAAKSYSRLIPHQIALCVTDGPVLFHKIDRRRTVTTWADGNPGASSLFRASGAYDGIEKYVQTPIVVRGATAAGLIGSNEVPSPDFIWMDVQGAEGLVLAGFGSRLADVKAIYVELSLREMYEGQAMAPEVVARLRENFRWHSVLHHGSWQFDALFISRNYSGPELIVRDIALRASLRTGLNVGIAFPAKKAGLRLVRAAKRRARRAVARVDRRDGSPPSGKDSHAR